ncbi:AAA family ATPase [Streptomyces kaniharaensis]|uniref:AAA family ATPase n=1 Tax=Streptomyces kaniharaensis TaxID=212423 RepID=UPI002DDD5491|nr:AAA family ATPase [Streptomyces kaniharaensis]
MDTPHLEEVRLTSFKSFTDQCLPLQDLTVLIGRNVNARDTELRRSADNVSAAVENLRQSDPVAFDRLTDLVAGMPEYPVRGISSVDTRLGDVQLVLREWGFHGTDQDVPARLLSDGMLRFLAFGTALLSAPVSDGDEAPIEAQRHLVIEEVENGLYPTQAARVAKVGFVRPTATVIETGNHVFQIKDGTARRVCASVFMSLLDKTSRGEAPWVLHERTWDGAFLASLCIGGTTGHEPG